jgi:hypothetical protein
MNHSLQKSPRSQDNDISLESEAVSRALTIAQDRLREIEAQYTLPALCNLVEEGYYAEAFDKARYGQLHRGAGEDVVGALHTYMKLREKNLQLSQPSRLEWLNLRILWQFIGKKRDLRSLRRTLSAVEIAAITDVILALHHLTKTSNGISI